MKAAIISIRSLSDFNGVVLLVHPASARAPEARPDSFDVGSLQCLAESVFVTWVDLLHVDGRKTRSDGDLVRACRTLAVGSSQTSPARSPVGPKTYLESVAYNERDANRERVLGLPKEPRPNLGVPWRNARRSSHPYKPDSTRTGP